RIAATTVSDSFGFRSTLRSVMGPATVALLYLNALFEDAYLKTLGNHSEIAGIYVTSARTTIPAP
ncbi:hypothetical protein, partial [Mesorhizobium sp.]